MWEKEKLLVTSNFSFSYIVFKRHELQTRKNQGLFGKGLSIYKLTCSSIYTRFNTLKKKIVGKHCKKKMKLLKMSKMFSVQSVISKVFNSHILVVVYSFFEFGMVSKWCIREWVNPAFSKP